MNRKADGPLGRRKDVGGAMGVEPRGRTRRQLTPDWEGPRFRPRIWACKVGCGQPRPGGWPVVSSAGQPPPAAAVPLCLRQ